jgi:hypothetical protein
VSSPQTPPQVFYLSIINIMEKITMPENDYLLATFAGTEIISFPKSVFTAFLKEKNPSDIIALFCFYYYISTKIQFTNQIKATTAFTASHLKWTPAKVRKTKNSLKDHSLIEDITKHENGKIIGHFIFVKYT